MERYENIIKIEEIRRLIDENLYTKAAKILDTMDVSRIKSLTDLSIIADVLTQNDRYEDAMEILLKIYNKSKTRRVLYQLVDISIRMEDLDKANEYLKMYIKLAPTDSHRFIFRYCIDKINQEPYEILLDSLEQLKEYDYIEMWAYELAKVYHKAGMKDKCVRECSDIILWFGDGIYVEKAKLLKAFYVGEINPAHIINAKNKKEAFLQMNLEKTRDYSAMRDEINEYLAKEEKELSMKKPEDSILTHEFSVHSIQDLVSVTMEEPVREVLDPAIANYNKTASDSLDFGMINNFYTDIAVDGNDNADISKGIDTNIDADINTNVKIDINTDMNTNAKIDIDANVDINTNVGINAAINTDINANEYTNLSEDINTGNNTKDINEIIHTDLNKSLNKVNNVDTNKDSSTETKGITSDISTDIKTATINIDRNNLDSINNQASNNEFYANKDLEAIMDTKKNKYIDSDIDSTIKPELTKEIITDSTKEAANDSKKETDIFGYFERAGFHLEEEFGAFLSVNGLKDQIQFALENILSDSQKINYLVIAGGKKSGRSTLAKKICKGLFALDWIKSPKVAKITGDKLNHVSLSGQKEKLLNSTIVVEDVSHLTEETCHKLVNFLEEMRDSIFVILEDEDTNIKELFLRYPFMSTYFTNDIVIGYYKDRELFGFAKEYINQQNYQFITDAKSELFQKIGQILTENDKPLEAVMELAKAVVKSADNRYKSQLAEILNNRSLDTEDLLYIVKEDILEV